ncbi:MAG: carbohydrate ABC transporter permease [Anaerolineae bacterium]|jgi:multiple sugar transport system permease protein
MATRTTTRPRIRPTEDYQPTVIGGHRQTSAERALVYMILLLGALLLMVPFLWMLSTSLKPLGEVFEFPIRWIPTRIVWSNYADVFSKAPFGRYLLNTVFITVVAIVGNLIGSSLAAFAFARFDFPGRNLLFLVMLSTMMVPAWVTMIPTFIMFNYFGWLDTFKPLLVPAFFAQPFYTFLLRQFFMGVPKDLEDAARIDGCSTFRIFWQVMLPLSRPALATVAIFSFFSHWNVLLGPLLYLQSQEKLTVSVGMLFFQGEQGTNYPVMMAAATISMLPCLVLFFLAQRLFIQGVVVSGVKG